MSNVSYSKLNLFIRSLIFSIFSLFTIMFYSTAILFLWPFPLSVRWKWISYFLSFYMKMLKLICHIDYHITGLENLPKDRNGIIMCKHQSTWETLLCAKLFYQPAAIAKRELMWVPFFGWGLAVSSPIFINRTSKSTAMQQIISKGKKFLDQGRWIMVFPEGTRTAVGTVGHYKLGGARLAAATGYPILPIAHNAGVYWPRRKFIKQPGTIEVIIGPLIESEGLSPEELLDLTKNWIEGAVAKLPIQVCSLDGTK